MMRKGFHFSKLTLAGAVALIVTASFYFSVHDRDLRNLEDTAVQMARQIAHQTETLAREAKQHGIKDSMNWAARTLSAGNEPRWVRVIPAHIPTSVTTTEVFELDRATGQLDFAKVFSNDTRDGVRIYIDISKLWVGSQPNVWLQDFILLTLFGGVFFGVWSLLTWRRSEKRSRMLKLQIGDHDHELLRRAILKLRPEIEPLERFEAVLRRINEYSASAERAAKSFVEGGYDDVREVVFQAQRLHDYLVKLHMLTDRGQTLLNDYYVKLKKSVESLDTPDISHDSLDHDHRVA